MSTPTPETTPLESVPVDPLPVAPTGPRCAACGQEAVVSWQRRPTDDELASIVAAEVARREQALRDADPQMPEPVFGPLPTGEDTLQIVPACATHAISLDGASRVHASACTAPNDADLPGCDCTPEPLPEPEPVAEEPEVTRLPSHWVNGGS